MYHYPLVSIITVVFNGDRYLQQTIDSVKAQTYKNIEYIVIDGGSTDQSHFIINKNIKYISQFISEPDDGLYDAMNKGIKLANGELIGIINSDDWYEINAVKLVVDYYNQFSSSTIFHGNMMHIYPNGVARLKKYQPEEWKLCYYGMVINHPTVFVHSRIYKKHLFNTSLRSLSDYQFMLTNFLEDKSQFCYINHIISNYRLGGISSSMTISKSLYEGYCAQRLAGLSILQASLSYLLRLFVKLVNKVK